MPYKETSDDIFEPYRDYISQVNIGLVRGLSNPLIFPPGSIGYSLEVTSA